MKTAVSVPDRLFDEAERLADHLGLARSELYARAIKAFVARHRATAVKEALDAVYAAEDQNAALDAGLEAAQRKRLTDEGW
jgi:predicted transcriptional regulator